MSNRDIQLTDKLEDYLEAIFILMKNPSDSVRIKDISALLEVNKATTVAAIKKLKESALAVQEPYGKIFLTAQGILYAKQVLNKHKIIKNFLIHTLQIDLDTAEKEACLMEHILSEETITKMRNFLA